MPPKKRTSAAQPSTKSDAPKQPDEKSDSKPLRRSTRSTNATTQSEPAKEEKQAKSTAGHKRKADKEQDNSAKKQQKQAGNAPAGTYGSKHMENHPQEEQRGSAERLPKVGQDVVWKAMPGYVDGKVKEVLTQAKNVDGKSVKASKEDPRLVLTSNKSGKVCVHKPDACFYE